MFSTGDSYYLIRNINAYNPTKAPEAKFYLLIKNDNDEKFRVSDTKESIDEILNKINDKDVSEVKVLGKFVSDNLVSSAISEGSFGKIVPLTSGGKRRRNRRKSRKGGRKSASRRSRRYRR